MSNSTGRASARAKPLTRRRRTSSATQPEALPIKGRFFIGANFHDAAPLSHFERRATRRDYRWTSDTGVIESEFEQPRPVTLAFRNIFWRFVFDEVVEIHRCDQRINWLETEWTLHSVWAANSTNPDVEVMLSERANRFLFFELSPTKPVDKRYIYARTLELGLDEQSSIAALLTAAESLPRHGGFIASHRHSRNFPGRFIHYFDSVDMDISDIIFILSFYSYCMLFIWQIGRFQAEIPIDSDRKRSPDQLSHALGIRAHIINVERHFLTTNVTNDPTLKKYAKDIRDRYRLKSRIVNLDSVHQSIEAYISTSSQITSDNRSRSINYFAFIFAAVSVPLAWVEAILAFDEDDLRIGATPIKDVIGSAALGTFLLDLAKMYIFGFAAASVLFIAGQQFARLATYLRRRFRPPAESGGNQKKRIFSGSRPRSASTNSAERNSPPAT